MKLQTRFKRFLNRHGWTVDCHYVESVRRKSWYVGPAGCARYGWQDCPLEYWLTGDKPLIEVNINTFPVLNVVRNRRDNFDIVILGAYILNL